ncbi:MAG: hypothetical protein AB1512_11340 [Thermodesulfobacteriota bacterium]
MKRFAGAMLVLMLGILSISVPGWAEDEEKPTASATMGAFSKYIWRGYELSDDGIVVQPSMTVGYKGFTMNLWGNLDTDLDDRDPSTSNEKKWNETDLTMEYAHKFGPVKLAAGYIYYALDSIDDSEEVYLSASLDVLLTPTLTVYREIAHAPSWYVKLGIGHSFDLGGGVSLELAGSAAYNYSDDEAFVKENTDEQYRCFHDGNLSAGLKIPITKYLVVNPLIAYSFPLSDTAKTHIRATSFSDDSDFLYGGVNLTLSF